MIHERSNIMNISHNSNTIANYVHKCLTFMYHEHSIYMNNRKKHNHHPDDTSGDFTKHCSIALNLQKQLYSY